MQIWEGGDENRQRKRIFCFSTRVFPLPFLRLEAAGSMTSPALPYILRAGLVGSHLPSCPVPTPLRLRTGDTGGSDITLLDNQSGKAAGSGPSYRATRQMLPLELSSSSSCLVPRSGLMLQLSSEFLCFRSFRTSLIISHFAPRKYIEHDVPT